MTITPAALARKILRRLEIPRSFEILQETQNSTACHFQDETGLLNDEESPAYRFQPQKQSRRMFLSKPRTNLILFLVLGLKCMGSTDRVRGG